MSADALIRALRAQLADLPGGAIVVAFSGGHDSSVLLHALATLAPARERGLRAIHIDHGVHADSPRWAEHCAGMAAALQIPFEAVAVGPLIASGKGLEAAARAARYAAFAERLHDGDTLATAQHADDQAETVLLKLLRGAGPEGLAGMRRLRTFARGGLWRPLLELPRASLHAYAQRQALTWLEDPSNADPRLSRNFLRHEVLPQLRAHWPEATAAIAHSAAWASATADYIGQQASAALARVRGPDSTTLRWHEWLALPAALRDPVLRLWLRSAARDEPAHFHVAELERQLQGNGDRALAVSWGNNEVRRYRDLLHAMPRQASLATRWQAAWDGTPMDLPDGTRLWLEPGAIAPLAAELIVHYRRGGERIKPAGSPHTRELRLLLQEAGIPPWLRERLPLVSAGTQLIAVADVGVSERGRELLGRGTTMVWSATAGHSEPCR